MKRIPHKQPRITAKPTRQCRSPTPPPKKNRRRRPTPIPCGNRMTAPFSSTDPSISEHSISAKNPRQNERESRNSRNKSAYKTSAIKSERRRKEKSHKTSFESNVERTGKNIAELPKETSEADSPTRTLTNRGSIQGFCYLDKH